MSSEPNNSLIDFDNFDPFAPTHQNDSSQSSNLAATAIIGENTFSNDPFADNFEADDWQSALQNIGTKDVSVAKSIDILNDFDSSVPISKSTSISSATLIISSSSKSNGRTKDDLSEKFNEESSTLEEYCRVEHRANVESLVSDPKIGFDVRVSQLSGVDGTASLEDSEKNVELSEILKGGETGQSLLEENLLENEVYMENMESLVKNFMENSEVSEKEKEKMSTVKFVDEISTECTKCFVSCEAVDENKECCLEDTNLGAKNDDNDSDDIHKRACKIVEEVYKHVSNMTFTDLKNGSADLDEESSLRNDSKDHQKEKENKFNETQLLCNVEGNQKIQATSNISHNNERNNNEDDSTMMMFHHTSNPKNEEINEVRSSNGHVNFDFVTSKTEIRDLNEDYGKHYDVHDNITPAGANNDQFYDLNFVENDLRPEKGLAGLKNFDRSIEDDFVVKQLSSSSKQNSKDSSQADKVSAMVFNYGSAMDNVCKQCNKRVYEMEKVIVDSIVYHKTCFRCATCGRTLSLGNYHSSDGQMYCRADFLKNFKMKGSYAFSTEPLTLESGDDETAKKNNSDDEAPVVPIRYMKNLFEKPSEETFSPVAARRDETSIKETKDIPDSGRTDVIVSSNVYVLEDELPPPSLARNLKAMFESKEEAQSSFQQSFSKPAREKNVDSKLERKTSQPKIISESEIETSAVCQSSEEAKELEIPQAGATKNLLARWRGLEETSVTTDERSRSRENKRPVAQRSQSTTRMEISQRLKVVADDRPRVDSNISKEEGMSPYTSSNKQFRDFNPGGKSQVSTSEFKTFKWQVREATPLNRPGVVHGDLPKYQVAVGDVINEKTPISEIVREEPRLSQTSRPTSSLHESDNDDVKIDSPAKGSYVTEIREEELPDSEAVKSAMLRFKSMEDPRKNPPVPVPRKSSTSSSKVAAHQPIRTTQSGNLNNVDDDDDAGVATTDVKNEEEELPATGTTKNLLAKFQSFQSK